MNIKQTAYNKIARCVLGESVGAKRPKRIKRKPRTTINRERIQ